MRKYAIVAVLAALIVAALPGGVGATHLSAGYMSSNGQMVLTLGGRYDLSSGHALEGAYSMMPGGFDVMARYKLPMYRSTFTLGPVFEGKITGDHMSADPAVGAGLFVDGSASAALACTEASCSGRCLTAPSEAWWPGSAPGWRWRTRCSSPWTRLWASPAEWPAPKCRSASGTRSRGCRERRISRAAGLRIGRTREGAFGPLLPLIRGFQ